MEQWRLVAQLQAVGRHADAKRIASCGKLLVLSCAKGHTKLVIENCMHRLCPLCRSPVAMRRQRKVQAMVRLAQDEGLRLAHLVLTVPNVGAIDKQYVQELHRSFWKLTRRMRLDRHVAGWIRCTELTRSGEQWHPHLHCIVALKPGFVNYGWLAFNMAMMWHGYTGCSDQCVDKGASMADDNKDAAFWLGEKGRRFGMQLERGGGCSHGGSAWLGDVLTPRDGRYERQGQDVAAEVCKYVTKGLEAGEETGTPLRQLAESIHRVRLAAAYGIFYGVGRRVVLPEADRLCPVCWERLEKELRNRSAWTPVVGPRGPPPDVEDAVEAARFQFLGSPMVVWRKAQDGDVVATLALRRLHSAHPELWAH